MIVHVMIIEKFMPSFIDFMMKHFDVGLHRFVFITSPKYQYGLQPHHPVEFLYRDEDFLTLESYFDVAEKIILHGLWRDKVNDILLKNKSWLDKSFWVMWGGDFYHRNQYKPSQLEVIKRIGYLITFMKEDVDWVRWNYQSIGQHMECFSYPSNICKYGSHKKAADVSRKNIMVGHSGVEDNIHIEIFDLLNERLPYSINVWCPLSYPLMNSYITNVVNVGSKMFGERFTPLVSWMNEHEYYSFLDSIDVAILPSWRQHAIGNIINLLGRGIHVYINEQTTSWRFFKRLGLHVDSYSHINGLCANYQNTSNIELVNHIFSEQRLINDWQAIFNS
ncbi:TDP-N-acetylfucosamine:lipid II N-acetylfucosaminyltransferase [Aeromonas sp. NJAU223]|uniref:TDP-N-acetylfucosamine:lipid II N-acetylfucosaminyltransferase n=1 Tax=Aeromonas sp. NJAU223 TaxID=3115650 RepID=UPI003DA9AB82